MSSNPAGRVSREFCAKNATTLMEAGAHWPVAATPEFFLGFFAIIFGFFLHFYFAECKSSPSVALGEENKRKENGAGHRPTASNLSRVPARHSAKPSPSARFSALGKDAFAG